MIKIMSEIQPFILIFNLPHWLTTMKLSFEWL